MRCDFVSTGENRHRCSRCGQKVQSKFPPAKIHARCKAKDGSEGVKQSAADHLAAAIHQHVSNGTATIPATAIEARLAVCRGCTEGTFAGDDCKLFWLANGCRKTSRYIPALVGAIGGPGPCERWVGI